MMVKLVRADRQATWMRDAADGLTSDERAEIRWLRRQVKQLEIEREILKKSAAWRCAACWSLHQRLCVTQARALGAVSLICAMRLYRPRRRIAPAATGTDPADAL
jgi:hypothetical protein